MKNRFPLFLMMLLILFSCAPTKQFSKAERKKLDRELHESPFGDHFTGLAVWDVENGEWLYHNNKEKLFTPASNVKLATLFTAKQVLGDSMPLFQYHIDGYKLHIRGMGNPVFLHPEFSNLHQNWIEKLNLKNIDSIYIHHRNMENERFGPGWAWDDYSFAYQAEVSTFPAFGNSLWVKWDSVQSTLQLSPNYVAQFTDVKAEAERGQMTIDREEYANQYLVKTGPQVRDSSIRSSPFLLDPYLLSRLLQDTFSLPVKSLYSPTSIEWKDFHPISLDTVYRKMMLESNNFIAEQLLLASSSQISNELSSSRAIKHIMAKHFPNYNEKIKWVDGSGLSRYNLMSPAFIIEVLQNLYSEIGIENLDYYFPVAGRSGTIKDWEVVKDTPFLFAKTGTLGNVYTVSGFLKTDGGKMLIFSFMNENFTRPSSSIQSAVLKILGQLKQSY